MDRVLIATRNGNNEEVVRLCKEKLAKDPNDISSHFSISQAYECLEEYELALSHIGRSLEKLPRHLESCSISTRCLINLKRYDEAYTYAQRGLNECDEIQDPRSLKIISNILSYIPGLSGLRNMDQKLEKTRARLIEQLKKYVDWYESTQVT